MKLSEKKRIIAGKMYDQNSSGGLGSNPVFKQSGKGMGSAPIFKTTGMGIGSSSPVRQASTGNLDKNKYRQAGGKVTTPMIKGSVKPSQKGKLSLNSQRKNEGEKMMLGKNEHNRA